MRQSLWVFLLAVKIALLAPMATATLGVVATDAHLNGASAPVTKVPHAPAPVPFAAAPARSLHAAAPQLGHARAAAEARDGALDLRARSDDVHVWRKGTLSDVTIPLDVHARGDPTRITQPDAQRFRAAARQLDAPHARGEPDDAPAAMFYPTAPALAADLADSGADAPAAPARHATPPAAPPARAAASGPLPPPGGREPRAASPLAVAATTGAAFALLLASLYARLRGASTLAHEKRAHLLAELRASPGMTTADAARALACDATTARHHLRTLVREGFAVDHAGRHFAAGEVPHHTRDAHVAAADSSAVLDAVRATPGASKQQIADALRCARATVTWHLKRLQQAGLVRAERDGKCVRVYPVG